MAGTVEKWTAWVKAHPAATAGGVAAIGLLIYMSGGFSSFASLLSGGGTSSGTSASASIASQMAANQADTAAQYQLQGQQQQLDAQAQIAGLTGSYQLASTEVQAQAQMQIAADTAGSTAYQATLGATANVAQTALASLSATSTGITAATGQGIAGITTQNAAIATATANIAVANDQSFSRNLQGAADLVSSFYGTGSGSLGGSGMVGSGYGGTAQGYGYVPANSGIYQNYAYGTAGGAMPVQYGYPGSFPSNVGTSGSGVVVA